MTNEEAIQWLDAIKKYYIHGGDEAYDKKRMKAIDKAIKALEQQPSEDCISREAVIKNIKRWFDKIELNPDILIDSIITQPSVIPQREMGKWIGEKPYPICDKCGCNIYEEYISCSDFAEIYKPMNYCPNCGAEMGGAND